MSEKVEHTALSLTLTDPSDGFEGYFLWRNNGLVAELSGPQNETRTKELQSIVDAANSYPALLAERDRSRETLKEAKEYTDAISASGFATDQVEIDALCRKIDAALKDTNQ